MSIKITELVTNMTDVMNEVAASGSENIHFQVGKGLMIVSSADPQLQINEILRPEKCEGEGAFLIEAAGISGLTQKMASVGATLLDDNSVTLEVDTEKNILHFSGSSVKCDFPLLDPDLFIPIKYEKNAAHSELKVSVPEFTRLLKTASCAVGDPKKKPMLECVHIAVKDWQMRASSLSGYSLARSYIDLIKPSVGEGEDEPVAPKASFPIVSKNIKALMFDGDEVTLHIYKDVVTFHTSSKIVQMRYSSELFFDAFSKYDELIKPIKEWNSFSTTHSFITSVVEVASAIPGKKQQVTFDLTDDHVCVTGSGGVTQKGKIEEANLLENTVVHFDAKRFSNVKHFGSKELIVSYVDGVLLTVKSKSDAERLELLIMAIRVENSREE